MEREPKLPCAKGKVPRVERPRLADWIWHPRYAKLWWTAVPAYWLGMLGSRWSDQVDSFYSTTFAALLAVFAFPPLVLAILGVGWARALIDEGFVVLVGGYKCRSLGPSGLPSYIDPLDPRSGINWVGSEMNHSNQDLQEYYRRSRHG